MCRAGHFDTLFGETMSQALEPKTVAKKARRGPTREDKVVERRLSLLEATLRVIARKGLIGVTMSDIASEAGCAYGVVAFHFKSKEGITLAALDYMVEEYDRTLRSTNRDTPEARLKAFTRRWRSNDRSSAAAEAATGRRPTARIGRLPPHEQHRECRLAAGGQGRRSSIWALRFLSETASRRLPRRRRIRRHSGVSGQ